MNVFIGVRPWQILPARAGGCYLTLVQLTPKKQACAFTIEHTNR